MRVQTRRAPGNRTSTAPSHAPQSAPQPPARSVPPPSAPSQPAAASPPLRVRRPASSTRVRSVSRLRRRLVIEENAVMVGYEIHVGTPKTHTARWAPYPVRSTRQPKLVRERTVARTDGRPLDPPAHIARSPPHRRIARDQLGRQREGRAADARARASGDDARRLRRPIRRRSGCRRGTTQRPDATPGVACRSADALSVADPTAENRSLNSGPYKTRQSGVRGRRLERSDGPCFHSQRLQMRAQSGQREIPRGLSPRKKYLVRGKNNCAPGGIRTPDPLLRTEWLFH